MAITFPGAPGLGLYGLARDAILKATYTSTANLVSGTQLSAMLVAPTGMGGTNGTNQYVAVQNTDAFVTIIPGSATNASSANGSVFAGSTGTAQVVSARTSTLGSLFITSNTLAFTNALPSGTVPGLTAGALIFWNNTGTPSTSALIAYIDYTNWTPSNFVLPSGSTITFTFASTTPGVFTI